MLETIKKIRDALARQRPVAYCRLIETRGSTPQKAGAMMLVYEDGGQEGTLGGGCVEAEVKRNALRVMQHRRGELTTFRLDHDYGWDDGLICGGRMTILIEPLAGDRHLDYFGRLVGLAESGQGFTEAIVFDEETSGIPVPSSFLFDADCQPSGALSIAAQDHAEALRQLVRPVTSRPRPYAERGVAFLPLAPRHRLLIVGGGHIGKAVSDLAVDLDFEVWVTDDRESYVSSERFPRAERRIAGPCQDVLPELEIAADTYCLIVTRGHNHDQEALYRLVNRGARYVGLIGSRRKIRKIFEDLIDEGVPAEALDQVYAPVGIDIGSQTVTEIAVSIVAELIAHRNREGQIPGRPERVLSDLP